jgi:hypothetical protein
MQVSGSGESGPEHFEQELRGALYRFDCPDAHTLGEYQLDLLEPGHRTQVAAHVAECDECRSELQTLRSFLAEPVTPPESLASRARRIVATLFTPRAGLAYGGLRGSADTSTRVFAAGDVTVTIGTADTRSSLYGLVVGTQLQQGATVSIKLVPREGAPKISALDDLGNFDFVDVAPGSYTLEVELPDGTIVIEELRVD